MKKLIMFSLLCQIVFAVQIQAQEKSRVFEVPPQYVSLLLVSDENCPIQLSNPKFLKYEKGTFEMVYTVFNRSDKSVRNFQIKKLNWFGNSEYALNLTAKDENSFLPYESFSSLANENKLEFINFDEKNAEKFELFNHPKNIWIVMITKVELWDEKTYDATAKYQDVEKFVENLEISSKLSKAEIDKKEIVLRDFISKTISAKE